MTDASPNIVSAIDDWFHESDTERKVIARSQGGLRQNERTALKYSRKLQDEGLVSIITRKSDRTVTHILERVS